MQSAFDLLATDGHMPVDSDEEYARLIIHAALDGKVLLVESYPNPGDGTALSEKEHDEAREAWYQIGEAKRLGYLIQVWPAKEES